MVLLKVVLLVSLTAILVQDMKERRLYWFLPFFVLVSGGLLFYNEVLPDRFWLAIAVNLCFVAILLSVVFLYTRYKLKIPLRESFGLGDGLLFMALAFGLNSIPFIVTFVFSLIFSLSLHLALKKKSTFKTVPLAGYMGLFYIFVYLAFWFGPIDSVYYT